MEIALPLDFLPDIQPGEEMNILVVARTGGRDLTAMPHDGPARVSVPDLGLTETIIAVDDPAHDDHGPGTYVYPTDRVFPPQAFDIEKFTVSRTPKNVIFRFKLFGPIDNPWGSGIGLSLQTFDVYIDTDPGKGTGPRKLLEGRNASLEKGYGWEYAIWVEGWTQKLLVPDASGKPVEVSGSPLKVLVDAAKREVSITVLLKALPSNTDPAEWAYAAVVLSQDGFPSPGVRRVRDVEKDAAQWRLGGAPDDANHTRILDVAWPAGSSPTQEQLLGMYPASGNTDIDELAPDDFAHVPMLRK
jgi:carbohydrate-binding DOMON domain-containing protein